jgi:ribosomal protein S1
LKGYTISEALHLYQALASIGEAQLSDFYKIVKDYVTLEEDASEEERLTLTDKIRGLLYDTLLSTLSKQEVDLNNIASAMAYKIIQNYRNNKSMSLEEKQLPISDTTMFKKLVSNLAVYLSNKGIKVKVQGILAILNPSYDLFKLYNGKKLEEYSDSRTFVATEGL